MFIQRRIALVNETYPVDCIQFGSILDVSQLRFQVNGAQLSSKTGTQSIVTPCNTSTLELAQCTVHAPHTSPRLEGVPATTTGGLSSTSIITNHSIDSCGYETSSRQLDVLNSVIEEA